MLSCSEANLNVMGACGMNNVKYQYNSAAIFFAVDILLHVR